MLSVDLSEEDARAQLSLVAGSPTGWLRRQR